MYVDDYGLTALLLSIFQNMTPEQAFRKLDGKSHKYTGITDEDIKDMVTMRTKGMTYKAIGECYGLSESQTYRRIEDYRKKRVI
ncbi:MAG: helix-turn-helix domain-containing protein [Lutispora sp.]|jgi:DNA invertase Pin-like site-specific DNA recombinase